MDEPAWTNSTEGLRLGEALVSFQRFPLPLSATVDHAPPSYGALPVAPAPSGFLLPLAQGEAFWIGILMSSDTRPASVVVRARRQDGQWIDVAGTKESSITVVTGEMQPDMTFKVFSLQSTSAISVECEGCCTRIDLTDPLTFSAITGQPGPEPLDSTSAYGGWRLP
jgi:hypothetical protein